MNKAQKEVVQAFLQSEEEVLRALNEVYKQAKEDIEAKIFELYSRKDLENLQSIIYQLDYQKALKKQIDGILDNMNSEQFKTVAEYLEKCYEEGYIGTLYDLQSQGIPLIMPIDQEAVVRAVKLDSKIKGGLYEHLGENVTNLKKDIAREVSRGISAGIAWHRVAQNISKNMIGDYKNPKGSYAYAMRIARTEGHRIQVQSAMDAMEKAKNAGADVVKQWDSTLDGRTRPTHRELDGQIRELDEQFEVAGKKADGPGMFGEPAEDCNCRCHILQRVRWAVGGSFIKMNNFTKQIETFESPEAYEEFKKTFFDERNVKYMKYVQDKQDKYKTKDFRKLLDSMSDREYAHYSKLLSENPIYNKSPLKTVKDIAKPDVSDIITDIDKKAIHDYMTSKSYVVNEKLRKGTILSREEGEFVRNLDTALDKMPTYKGNLQRSLYFYSDDDVMSFLSTHKNGSIVKYNEYISATTGDVYNPEGQVQIYIKDSKSGKDISSFNIAESEVIYKRGSSFEVINVVEHDGKHYILAVENDE